MSYALKSEKMQRFQLEINENGYLILPQNVAMQYFSEDSCVALLREPELWVLPVRGTNSGGLLIKQRNASGDRSVLVHEALPLNFSIGFFTAFWDEENHALRIALKNG